MKGQTTQLLFLLVLSVMLTREDSLPLTACRCWDGPAWLGSSGAGSSDSLASDALSSKTKACFFSPTLDLCACVARGESGLVGMGSKLLEWETGFGNMFVLLGRSYYER